MRTPLSSFVVDDVVAVYADVILTSKIDMYIPLRPIPKRGGGGGGALFFIGVSINWATDRN